MSNKNTPEDMERTVRLDTQEVLDPYADPIPLSVDSIEDILSAEEFSDTPDISFEVPEETIISPQEKIDFDDLTKEMNNLSHEFELNALEEKVPATITESKPKEVKPAVTENKPKEAKVAVTESKPKEAKVAVTESKPKEAKVAVTENKPKEAKVAVTENKPKEAKVAVTENKPKEAKIAVTEGKPKEENITEKLSNTATKETFPKVSSSKVQHGTTPSSNTAPTNKKNMTKAKDPAPISTTKKTASPTNKPSKGISAAMLFIPSIALIAGLTGVWASMSSKSHIDTLSAQLNAVESNRLNNQEEFIAIQKQLTSLKRELDSLKVKHKSPALIKSETSNIIQPATKVVPAIITPTTPVQEMKPTLLKNTWNVIVSSHDSMKKAKKEQQREAIKGMKTSIVAVIVKGKNWYRIVATGFTDKQKAITFTHKLKQHGISDAWVQYNK